MIFRFRFFVNRERGSCASSFCTVSSNLGFGAPYSWAQRGASDELRHSIIERLDNQKGPLPGYMDVLTRMERQGRIPSVNAYRSILKECGKRKALTFAKRVHAHLAKHGLESNRSLSEFVVSILVKCGDIEAALQVFRRLPHRTVLSWTAIISGYTSTGQSQRAIRMFQWMKEEGVQPNAFTIVSLLKACGAIASLEEGKRIHGEAVKHRCETDLFVHSCLVDMYGRCGSIVDAQNVFDELTQPDVVAWTALLTAYVQQAQAERALEIYEQMLEKGVSPDSRTFVVALQVCGMLAEKEDAVTVKGDLVKPRSLKMGKEMHASAQRNGSDRGLFVGSSLIGMYGKCGNVVDARNVFEALLERNMVCWTVMLAAYVQQGEAMEVLKLYKQMQEEGLSPDIRTYASAIQACGKLAEVEQGIPGDQQSNYADKGKAVHARAWRKGYDMDVVVGSALTSMYAKCGTILDAQIVFDRLLQRDVVAWTVLVMAYVEHGQAEKALCLYEQMQEEGVSANTWTFVSVLQGCCRLAEMEESVTMDGAVLKPKSLVKGKAIHADARRKSYDTDAFVANTLVAMYGKCGVILDAENVFFMLSRQTVVAWTAMVAIYVEHDCAEKAVQLYEQMQAEGWTPDEVAIVWVLQAYSTIGSLPMVRHIHHNLVSGRNELTPILAATLVTAYGKCSSLVDAQRVFDEVRKPSVVLWTALIAAYARQGKSVASLQCYEDMRLAGVKPDDVTFLSLLSACGHAGLTDQGILYFESMSKDFGIAPKIEHFVSMVDLLGRAGCFSRIKDLLSVMPMQPTLAMWLCILGACRKHGKVVLGEQAFSCAVRLQPEHSAAFVLMSNIYADAGLFEHAESVREQEVAVKKPGQSWIEHEQVVHTFLVQDRKHAQHRQIHDLLWNAGLKLNREGHIPHTPNVLNTMGQGPEESLHGYVDQLALVSGRVGRALRGL